MSTFLFVGREPRATPAVLLKFVAPCSPGAHPMNSGLVGYHPFSPRERARVRVRGNTALNGDRVAVARGKTEQQIKASTGANRGNRDDTQELQRSTERRVCSLFPLLPPVQTRKRRLTHNDSFLSKFCLCSGSTQRRKDVLSEHGLGGLRRACRKSDGLQGESLTGPSTLPAVCSAVFPSSRVWSGRRSGSIEQRRTSPLLPRIQ